MQAKANIRALASLRIKAALLLVFLVPPLCYGRLANSDKQGLRCYTIESVLRLKDEEIDIGTAALLLSREWGAARTTHVYRAKIDDFAEDILKQLSQKHIRPDYRAISIINEYLFSEQGLTSVDNADHPEDLFLHTVLDKKRGYCLSLSVLYMAVCERVGVPVYGVVVPGHFFVRYDDGKRKYNIETTSKGAIVEDAYYIEKFKPPASDKALYMKNLTPGQTLGCFFNNLGNSYMDVGDINKAFEILKKAVEINPMLSEANMNLGNIYLQKQMPREAIRQYENALAILGNEAKTMNNLGSAYMQLENYSKAEGCYKSAINMDPQYFDARRNLASALDRQGKLREAASVLHAAIVLNPADIEATVMLGLIYNQLKEYRQSEKYLTKAIELSGGHPQAGLALGYTYLEQGKYEQALEMLQSATAYNTALPQVYFAMGQAYHKLGRTEDEIWSYEQAVERDPAMAAAYQNLGNAYIEQNNIETAIRVYQKGLEAKPDSGSLRYNLAAALAQNNMHEQAVTEYLAAIRLDPKDAKAYNGAAISYYYLKEFDNAKAFAKKAKKLGFDVQDELLDLK